MSDITHKSFVSPKFCRSYGGVMGLGDENKEEKEEGSSGARGSNDPPAEEVEEGREVKGVTIPKPP